MKDEKKLIDWIPCNFNIFDIFETRKVWYIPVSQLKPVHPLSHVQLYEPILLWHVPCVQGSERHSSISSKKWPDNSIIWNFCNYMAYYNVHFVSILWLSNMVTFDVNFILTEKEHVIELPVLQYGSVNPVWQAQKKLPGVLVQFPCWHGWEVAHSLMSEIKQNDKSKTEIEKILDNIADHSNNF